MLALVHHFVEVFHGGGVGIEVTQGDEQSIARYFDHVFPMHFLLVDVVDPIVVMGSGRFCPNGLQFVGRQQQVFDGEGDGLEVFIADFGVFEQVFGLYFGQCEVAGFGGNFFGHGYVERADHGPHFLHYG